MCPGFCYNFLNLTFVKWNTGCQMVNHGSTTDNRNSNREIYYSWVLEEIHSMPGGHELISIVWNGIFSAILVNTEVTRMSPGIPAAISHFPSKYSPGEHLGAQRHSRKHSRVQREYGEIQDLEPLPLLGLQVECFGVPGLGLNWSIQTKITRLW